jgi:hypothetical protein
MAAPHLAVAQTDHVQPASLRTLVGELEADLMSLGCNASLAEDVDALQSTIVASGADPVTVQAALSRVEGVPGLCGAERVALADVDRTVALALQGTYFATSNGPGPGVPIGPPTTAVGGGGSDYRP